MTHDYAAARADLCAGLCQTITRIIIADSAPGASPPSGAVGAAGSEVNGGAAASPGSYDPAVSLLSAAALPPAAPLHTRRAGAITGTTTTRPGAMEVPR